MRWFERKVSEDRQERKIRAWTVLPANRDFLVMHDCSRFAKVKLKLKALPFIPWEKMLVYYFSLRALNFFSPVDWSLIVVLGLMKRSVWSNHFWFCVGLGVGSFVQVHWWSSTISTSPLTEVAFGLVVCLDHCDTTHSRIVHIPTKEMICNLINSKIMDSLPFMAICYGRMLFAWLIGLLFDLMLDKCTCILLVYWCQCYVCSNY